MKNRKTNNVGGHPLGQRNMHWRDVSARSSGSERFLLNLSKKSNALVYYTAREKHVSTGSLSWRCTESLKVFSWHGQEIISRKSLVSQDSLLFDKSKGSINLIRQENWPHGNSFTDKPFVWQKARHEHHESLRGSVVRRPIGIWEVMGSNPVGTQIFFFLPRSGHNEQHFILIISKNWFARSNASFIIWLV